MLVLRPGALGDTLLAVPALRALRRTGLSLTLGASAAAARLLEAVGEVDRGLAFDDPLVGRLFADTHPSDDQVVAWMSRATAPRHATLVAPSRPPAMDRHCARHLLETLEPLGIQLTWDEHPLAVSPLLSDEVLVHPGSGSTAKNWPAQRFAAVIRALDAPVRLVAGEADAAAAALVETHLGRKLARLEQPPLEVLAARLAGSRGYLGNDSGVSQLAGLCGARTIVVFGPSDPNVWHPLGPDVHAVHFDDEPDKVARLLQDP